MHTHNATKPRSHTHGSSHACPSPNPTDGTAAQQRNATEPRVHSCVQTSPPNPGNRSRSNARITSRQTTPLLPTRQPTRERRAHKGGQTNKHTEQLDYGETKPNTHLIYSHSRPVTDAATNTAHRHTRRVRNPTQAETNQAPARCTRRPHHAPPAAKPRTGPGGNFRSTTRAKRATAHNIRHARHRARRGHHSNPSLEMNPRDRGHPGQLQRDQRTPTQRPQLEKGTLCVLGYRRQRAGLVERSSTQL